MTHIAHSQMGSLTRPLPPLDGRPPSSLTFDRLMALLGAWVVLGTLVDGYFHLTNPELETFFTPWHAILYSGFLACALAVGAAVFRNYRRGYSLARSVPAGYELALLGVPFFILGGVGDMTWHIIFGIEARIDALLSPTHLLLAFSASLIITGPARAAWQRADASTTGRWSRLWPMLLAMALVYFGLSFFTQFANPFAIVWAAPDRAPQVLLSAVESVSNPSSSPTAERLTARITEPLTAIGVASTILQTALLMGVLLLVVRRWPQLPPGALTFVLTIGIGGLVLMRATVLTSTGVLPLIMVALFTGVTADLLLKWLQPGASAARFLLFATLVPIVLYTLYFSAVYFAAGGIWWSVHLWTGNIAIAGVVGYLVGLLAVQPQAAVLE